MYTDNDEAVAKTLGAIYTVKLMNISRMTMMTMSIT